VSSHQKKINKVVLKVIYYYIIIYKYLLVHIDNPIVKKISSCKMLKGYLNLSLDKGKLFHNNINNSTYKLNVTTDFSDMKSPPRKSRLNIVLENNEKSINSPISRSFEFFHSEDSIKCDISSSINKKESTASVFGNYDRFKSVITENSLNLSINESIV